MSLTRSILSAVGAAAPLFAGSGALTLGPVRFSGLGKPVSMPIGGRQAIATHRLPGGGRVLDVMGPDNSDIAWSGYLDGSDASLMARALDTIRQSGQVVTLAWDVYSYQVLVSEFSCETRHSPMPYRIKCAVVVDNSQAAVMALTSLALQVASDLAVGNSLAALSTGGALIVGDTITAASSAAAAMGATTLGSTAYSAATGAVSVAVAAVTAAGASAAAALAQCADGLNTLSVAAPVDLDAPGMSSQIVTACGACGDLANLSSTAGYLSRAASNLQSASA